MPFPVSAPVPAMYEWVNLEHSLTATLATNGINNVSQEIIDHYAWLLHITSWSYGLDWDPKAGVVSLEIPFTGMLATIDTRIDRNDYDRVIAQDEISLILNKCIEHVPLKRLLAHAQQVK